MDKDKTLSEILYSKARDIELANHHMAHYLPPHIYNLLCGIPIGLRMASSDLEKQERDANAEKKCGD